MTPLRIALVSSEMAPFAKTGGLGDVTAALGAYLHRAGHDARTFLPLYRRIVDSGLTLEPVPEVSDVPIPMGRSRLRFSLVRATVGGGQTVYFVACPSLYNRPDLYTSDSDEHLRFAALSRAAVESWQRLGWSPDVAHCNDWQTALLPLLLKTAYSWDRLVKTTRSVLTIHNIGYQGVFPARILADLGFADNANLFYQEDLDAGVVNFLKTGILYADVLTTVSETYAREIQTPTYSAGLHDLLRRRRDSLFGIVNGVDYGEWSPEHDRLIVAPYSRTDPSGKELNRRALVEGLGLSFEPTAAVIGIVSRLTAQKGFDLFEEALPPILAGHDIRLVVLGDGEERYVELFRSFRRRFPNQVAFFHGYSNQLAHQIEAGSDLFLMPSRYEPCGLNQMYSLRYGAIPVVRATGGLADTVVPFDTTTGTGTGFVFEHFTPQGLHWALTIALATWRNRAAWARLRDNAMAQSFSWDEQGARYVALYRHLLKNRTS